MPRWRWGLDADAETNRQSTQDWTMLGATWAIVYGMSLIVQDSSIWAASTYDTAKILPCSPTSWGVILTLGGLFMFIGMFFGKSLFMTSGAMICALWNLFFGISLGKAFLHDGLSFSPLSTYFALMGAYIVCFLTYRRRNAIRRSSS